MGFDFEVYKLARKIPRGRISTYKIIAEQLGTKAYRAVGQALRKNPYAPIVPCHRVVGHNGGIGGFNGHSDGRDIEKKIRMLRQEGIEIENKRIVNLGKRLFRF